MRIIGGICKGRKLVTPENNAIRPTSDRVRESIFNILGNQIKGACVLDLFAGTGALGIESLSRGADSVLFMDIAKGACRIIRQNIDLCGLADQAALVPYDLSKSSIPPEVAAKRFDLLFMDPPYERGLLEKPLRNNTLLNCLDPGAVIIVEHSPKESIPADLKQIELYDQRKYGKSMVSFLSMKY